MAQLTAKKLSDTIESYMDRIARSASEMPRNVQKYAEVELGAMENLALELGVKCRCSLTRRKRGQMAKLCHCRPMTARERKTGVR